MKKQILFFLAIMIPAFAFTQDLVTLKSGRTFYKCKILKEDSLNVYIQVNKISTFANKKDIQTYLYDYKAHMDAFEEQSPRDFYAYKISKYTRMKKTGIGLGVSGGALAVIGLFLVSNADWEQVDNNTSTSVGTSYNTTSASGMVGVLCIIGGVATSTVGIILGSRGSKYVKKYQEKLKHVSLNLIYNSERRGFALRYRF